MPGFWRAGRGRLSWKEVAGVFHTSWEQVFRVVERAVEWGRAHQDLSGVSAIGIDELARQRGHRYLTLVYQIDDGRGRLLWVGRERREKTLEEFFDWFGEPRSAGLAFIASDMWKPYLKVIARKAGQALHVLDRFHIMAHMSKAIDEVRAKEARELAAKGYEPVLKHTRWLLLKRAHNLSEAQEPQTRRAAALQLALRARLSAQRGLSLLLGVRIAVLGGSLSRPLVHAHDAFQARPDEASRAHVACSSALVVELVSRQGCHFLRPRGGLQHQGETGSEKSLWIPHRPSDGNLPVSCTWRPTRASIHPQVLLRRLKYFAFSIVLNGQMTGLSRQNRSFVMSASAPKPSMAQASPRSMPAISSLSASSTSSMYTLTRLLGMPSLNLSRGIGRALLHSPG